MRGAVLAALALVGCVARGPLPDLPARAGAGPLGSPGLNALANAAEAFSRPSNLRGRPAEAALAAAQVDGSRKRSGRTRPSAGSAR